MKKNEKACLICVPTYFYYPTLTTSKAEINIFQEFFFYIFSVPKLSNNSLLRNFWIYKNALYFLRQGVDVNLGLLPKELFLLDPEIVISYFDFLSNKNSTCTLFSWVKQAKKKYSNQLFSVEPKVLHECDISLEFFYIV